MEQRTFGQFEVRREEGFSAAGCFARPIVIHKAVGACEGLKRGTWPGFLFSLSLSLALILEISYVNKEYNFTKHNTLLLV